MKKVLLVLINLAALIFFYPALFVTLALTVIFWPKDKAPEKLYMTLPNGKKQRIK